MLGDSNTSFLCAFDVPRSCLGLASELSPVLKEQGSRPVELGFGPSHNSTKLPVLIPVQVLAYRGLIARDVFSRFRRG